MYLNGIVRRYIFMGVGLVVYLFMINGSIICIGIMGTANKVSVFFFISVFISFRFVKEFVVVKLIC